MSKSFAIIERSIGGAGQLILLALGLAAAFATFSFG